MYQVIENIQVTIKTKKKTQKNDCERQFFAKNNTTNRPKKCNKIPNYQRIIILGNFLKLIRKYIEVKGGRL